MTQVSNKEQMVPLQMHSLSYTLLLETRVIIINGMDDRMNKDPSFPKGSAKQHPLERHTESATDNTKAP